MSVGEVGGEAVGAKSDDPETSAFRRGMNQRRARVTAAVIEALARDAPSMIRMGEAALTKAIDRNVVQWLDAIDGPGRDALVAEVDGWCSAFRTANTDPAKVLGLLERTAEVLLDIALELLEEGVPGAEDGARGVLDALAATTMAYDRAFRLSAEEEAGRATIMRAVTENAPDAIGVAGPDGHVQYVNRAFVTLVGREPTSDMTLFDFVHPDDVPKIHQMAETARATGKRAEGVLRYLRPDGSMVKAHVSAFRVLDEQGQPLARCGIIRDMTDEERALEERRALEEQILSVQAEALSELGAPMMPLARGVVAMPLVGTIDVGRAERILKVMLDGIMQTGAGHVIIDITGVPVVDAEVADAIARAAKAAQLVGTEVVITGIRGAVAQTLVGLGVDLGGVDTWSTLRQGVAHAIVHERKKRGRGGAS